MMFVFQRKQSQLFSCYVSTSLYFGFELGLVCVLHVVIGFDVPLAWSYQPKEQSVVL